MCAAITIQGCVSDDPHKATKFVVDLLSDKIWPLIKNVRLKLRNRIKETNEDEDEDALEKKLSDVFTLCCNQTNKCIIYLFDIFKVEYKQKLFLQESRHCTLERLSWCLNRLNTLNDILDSLRAKGNIDEEFDESFLITPMYFVNWIDHTFETLSKLSSIIYRTDYKESENLHEIWKEEVVDCVSDLHISLDELLLSAMTLCKYCLPSDQVIVRARSQVVLREAKTLLTELINGDIDSKYKVTKESLKLPLMPSNVNVLIDVLKDVLYALETNTNTALLSLLVHCFSNTVCPVERLRNHLKSGVKGKCMCLQTVVDVEECHYAMEFDMHNERLMQIGSFAVSCSSDQNRISILRSGLASLEALDPYLVPALMLSPDSEHAKLMTSSWQREVNDIRDSVFLIVDPAAFAEKAKHMMHHKISSLISENGYNIEATCAFVNVGAVVYEFFCVYNRQEPDALVQKDVLIKLMADLKRVLGEVKIVSNLLCFKKEYLYDIKMPKTKREATIEQLTKRLKLLYTLVCRINAVFHPKENDEQLFVNEICEAEPKVVAKNVTHTVFNGNTYINSPKKAGNCSKSVFARTTNLRSPSNKFILKSISKQLKYKRNTELSFSVKIDEMFDMSGMIGEEVLPGNKFLRNAREVSILYGHSPRKNKSLRKTVLSKNCMIPFETSKQVSSGKTDSVAIEGEELMDFTTNLQITEILDQMNDITNTMHVIKPRNVNSIKAQDSIVKKNILTLPINKRASISKEIWNIPVVPAVEMSLNDTTGIVNMSEGDSQQTDVNTLERINDLDLVESRLSTLKMKQQETSL